MEDTKNRERTQKLKNNFSKTLGSLMFTALLFFMGCSDSKKYHEEYKQFYDNAGFTGSFILYDMKKNIYHIYNKDRIHQRFVPASTFKIMNSLIAFETGVVNSDEQIFKWDSIKRDISTWNQDLTLKQAYDYSAVPVYQEIARKIGPQRMMEYIVKADYGNKNIGSEIDSFWLKGPLQISQKEQVDFLKRLYENDLPFSDETQEQVKQIMLSKNEEDYLIRSKTGLAQIDKIGYIGWYVGWVETKDNVYFFANNIETPDFGIAFLGSRILITQNILEDLGILKKASD